MKYAPASCCGRKVYEEWATRFGEQYLNLFHRENRDDYGRIVHHRIGVSGYEHVVCWRNEGVFQIRMRVPASSYRYPQCGNWDVILRGVLIGLLTPVGLVRIIGCSSSRHHVRNVASASGY